MNHWKVSIATLGMLMVLSGLLIFGGCSKKDEGTSTEPDEINFTMDYDSALALAQEKNQNLVIDFYTDWCRWCKVLDSATYTDSAVIALSKTMVFTKINAEEDTLTAQEYSISGYPTIVIAKSDGTEIDRIGGYLPPEPFLETIENYLQDKETLADYLRRADTNATTEVNFALGEKYSSRGMDDEAKKYFMEVIKMDPENKDSLTIDAMLSIGSIMIGEKDYKGAIGMFDQVIKNFKGTPAAMDAVLWKGVTYRNQGDTTKAIQVFEGYLKEYPDSPDTTYARDQIARLKNPPVEGADK